MLVESNFEINPVQGDIAITNTILLDFNNPTISVYGNNGHSLTFNGAINQNTTGSLTNQGNNVVVFNAANAYQGDTTIKAGELRFGQSGASNNSTIRLLNTTGTASATVTLAGAAAQNLSSSMVVQTGSSGTAVLQSQNASATTTQWNGTTTLNRGLTVGANNSGATLQVGTLTASSAQTVTVGSGTAVGANNGTVSFAGNVDNLNVGAVVNSGTLLLAKTSSALVHAVGSGLTVNAGATAKLGGTGGDQIFDSMAVNLNGGTFDTGGVSEGSTLAVGIGALSLASNSIINMSGSSIIHFAASGSQTWGGQLSIYNWNGTPILGAGTEQILFGTGANSTSLTSTQLNNILFYSGSGTGFLGTAAFATLNGVNGEIVPSVVSIPVPEPSTWAAAALALGAIVWTQRRRFAFRKLAADH